MHPRGRAHLRVVRSRCVLRTRALARVQRGSARLRAVLPELHAAAHAQQRLTAARLCLRLGHVAADTLDDALRAVAREHLDRALAASHGDRQAAARALGITRQRLYRLLDEHPDLARRYPAADPIAAATAARARKRMESQG